MRVRSRVTIGSVVAAPDMAADQADPKVQPLAADLQAVFAAVNCGRKLADGDVAQVPADHVVHGTVWTGVVRPRCAWTN